MNAAAQAAGPEGGRDPLGALKYLVEADDTLEAALVSVRDEQSQRAKAAAALERGLYSRTLADRCGRWLHHHASRSGGQ